MTELLGLASLLAAADVAGTDPIVVAATIIASAIAALTGVQTHQMSSIRAEMHGIRNDLQDYRQAQDARMRVLEDRVANLEGPPRRRTRATGANSTTRGKPPRPKTPPRD